MISDRISRPPLFLNGVTPSDVSVSFPGRGTRILAASRSRRCCQYCFVSFVAPTYTYILRSADVYLWEQGGQEYARRAELRELARLEKAEKEAARSTSEKDKKE